VFYLFFFFCFASHPFTIKSSFSDLSDVYVSGVATGSTVYNGVVDNSVATAVVENIVIEPRTVLTRRKLSSL